MDWKSRLPGCFGTADLKFARHPSDRNQAFALLTACKENRIELTEIAAEMRNYITQRTSNRQGTKADHLETHIKEEIAYMEELFEPWL